MKARDPLEDWSRTKMCMLKQVKTGSQIYTRRFLDLRTCEPSY